ncbi:guanine nucleotide-binding G(o) subunit alpha, partial [Pelobates cultripes]
FKGRGNWRLNESLLQDSKFVEQIRVELTNYFQINSNGETSVLNTWSAHKAVVRGLFIRQSSYLKKHRQTTILACQTQLTALTAQNKHTPSRTLARQIQALTDKLTELNVAKTSYLLHKLKATQYHHSGKATRHLTTRLK